MADVSSTQSSSDVLGNYSINQTAATSTPKKSNELGQDAFLQLMITQMKNQDPLSPQDNSQFVAQLAQFSQVQGLQTLNTNFSSFSSGFMSNQALQASSLVGRSVSVDGTTSALSKGGIISGTISVPAATSDLNINVYSADGTLAANIPVGTVAAGDNDFRFDGQNFELNGKLLNWTSGDSALPSGDYTFEALASQNGTTQQLATSLSANVNSVTVGADGKVVLNLAGYGPTDMSK